ncbi:ABATE domain-containing protein [Allokutzneria sp. A3M-2-11 16]|uniref:CGNR zinc finger domain-containing protein n=1 Tax=Allokutzneria sp. A3M-2-11 16 TaxID=2962043 RepID=UPI0020B67F5D|nr:ABATE domain-containing protein [Allokutzneria sp. A3M-2-11 16]MCP3804009.1 ABATE domain-containing protein [Allokutzneria sp. A3M-2-11 16]
MFPLLGEPLPIDLLNTRTSVEDLLTTPRALAAWLDLQAERLPPLSRVDLAPVLALRDHVSDVVHAARIGVAPPRKSLSALTSAQRAAPVYRELSWSGSAVAATPRRAGDATAVLLAVVAEATADLLTGPEISKIRDCEGPDCRLVFLPAHPRRRWCSPKICGNRVRVARYYHRHKP